MHFEYPREGEDDELTREKEHSVMYPIDLLKVWIQTQHTYTATQN